MAKNKKKTSQNKLEAVDLNRFIFDIIQELPERSRNIIIKRFNLDNKGAKTLDKIGKDYGITRERVRQIEAEAILRMKKIGEKYNINLIFKQIKDIVKNNGGVMSEENLISSFLKRKNSELASKQIFLLILSLNDKIKVIKETKIYKKIYYYEKESLNKFKETIKILENYLLQYERSLNFEDIVSLLKERQLSHNYKKFIKSYLESNKIILENIIGQWGHEKWSHINPKSVRDKAYLILRKNGKELHFIEITNKINKYFKGKRKANNQTVHNELIKDKRFILIGRGIYALSEWGYKSGTVLDVLLEIFKEDNRKMSQDEIIEKVLKKRKVKKNTIILNLQNKKYFEKMENKIYKSK